MKTSPDAAPSHVTLLRSLAARLEAIGSPAAELALNKLAESTETHLKTVEMVVALTEAMENAALIH